MTRKPLIVALLIAASLSTLQAANRPAPSPAAPPPSSPAPAAPALTGDQAFSPAVQEALEQLGAAEYATREKGVEALQQAMARQLRALVASKDAETQARLAGLLEYQDALCRWTMEVLKQPAEVRGKILAWGLSPEALGPVSKIYGKNLDKRIEGVKELGKLEGDGPSWLLAQLLNDDTRGVYLAAMEAVWDRKPTEEIVDALWTRAVEAGHAAMQPRVVRPANGANAAVFRGRVLGGAIVTDMGTYRRSQDSDVATEVLVNLKAPQVKARIKTFMAKMAKDAGDANKVAFMMPYSEPTRNLYRLLESYKVLEALPSLMKIAEAPLRTRSGGNLNGQAYFWSNRTAALAAAVKLTGQDPEDYKLKRTATMGNTWTISSEKEENQAIEKLKAWCEKHKDALKDADAAKDTKESDRPEAATQQAM